MWQIFASKKKNESPSLVDKKGYNPYLLSMIQPQGGISFKERWIQKGEGYEACIHVFDFPALVGDYWLERIFNMPHTIVTLDVATEKKSEVVAAVDKSLREQEERFLSEKKKTSQRDAQSNYQNLSDLYDQVSQQGEVVKRIHLRLFVSAKTKRELEGHIKRVIEELEGFGFQGSVFLNEQEFEWRSLFEQYAEQSKRPNKRKGKEITSLSLAGSYPFHFTQLDDPTGTFFGTTFTGGNVLFDLFYKDSYRRYYNGVILGTMGAGKSTLLKKILTDQAIRGNFIRGFDVTGEFVDLIQSLGGRMIALDGSHGMMNPLQIFKLAETDSLSFMKHISKLGTFYRFIAPMCHDEDVKEFEKLLRQLYIEYGIWNEVGQEISSNLQSEDYPIFTDLLQLIQEELYMDIYQDQKTVRAELSPSRVGRLEGIELTIGSLVRSYSYLFNGHSTIPDITEEPIVMFSMRGLSSLAKEIFNAQMFNVLHLLWENLLKHGKPQWEAFNQQRVDFEDILRFLIVMDEAHRLINPENMLAVKFLTDFSREARKYFGGLLFASQSIRDMVPDGAGSSIVIEEIKKLFELTQYKFLMQQDTNAKESLRKIFEGQLSLSEIDLIPALSQGQCILSITGVGNITFKVEASDEELRLFTGGA